MLVFMAERLLFLCEGLYLAMNPNFVYERFTYT